MTQPSSTSTSASGHHLRGLGALAALILLVVLSSLAAAIVKMGWTAQTASAQVLQGAQALQAANAGVQWGLSEAMHGSWAGTCGTGRRSINLRPTLGFTVGITCAQTTYNEGETSTGAYRTVTVYTIEATACNSATGCPDAAMVSSPYYVERVRRVVATDKAFDTSGTE